MNRFTVIVTRRDSLPDGRTVAVRFAVVDREAANRTAGGTWVFLSREDAQDAADALNADGATS